MPRSKSRNKTKQNRKNQKISKTLKTDKKNKTERIIKSLREEAFAMLIIFIFTYSILYLLDEKSINPEKIQESIFTYKSGIVFIVQTVIFILFLTIYSRMKIKPKERSFKKYIFKMLTNLYPSSLKTISSAFIVLALSFINYSNLKETPVEVIHIFIIALVLFLINVISVYQKEYIFEYKKIIPFY